MSNIIKTLKNTGNFFGAIGYYISTIIIALILAVVFVAMFFLSSYDNITSDYSNVQIAWNNVDNDIASDLRETKTQIAILNTLNTIENPYYSETSKNLKVISNMIQDIDNAMSYQQKIAIYKEVEALINDTSKMTKYLDTNNEYPFDANKLLSNNSQLKEEYNNACKSINNKIFDKKYKIIVNAFSLHSWTLLP